jgi:uncharacterized LabA/DUF88 family protein
MNNDIISIGLFIDGGYYAKVNQALEETLQSRINVAALFSFIKEKVAQLEQDKEKNCLITESHFYRGRYKAYDAQKKNLLYSERRFEDSLIENDVVFHYKHLREIEKDGKTTVIEKGVDVWFALEAYEIALYREFDYVVLITGDADHEMLIRKLKAIKAKPILLTWNLTQQNSTSRLLSDEAFEHIEISDVVETDKLILKKLLC